MTITSRTLQLVLNSFSAGRSALMYGRMDEIVLLHGEECRLTDAILRLGARAYDVVAVFDPLDGWTVAHGEELRQVEIDRRSDPFLAVRELLADHELSVLVVIAQADIVLQDPATHDLPDRARVAALRDAIASASVNGLFRNSYVLMSDDAGSVPDAIRATDRLELVPIGLPTPTERWHLLSGRLPGMFGIGDLAVAELPTLTEQYVRLTEGYSLVEVDSLSRYSQVMRESAQNPRRLLHRHRFGETPDYWSAVRGDLNRIDVELRANVFGQDDAIELVVEGLAGASIGLSLSSDPYNLETQPRLTLMFLGPTGVGKTELVKELARCLFGDASAYVRLDMGTFAQEHAAERLTGAPPGYVGFDAGGELTNAVLENPFQVILLDEIEKAHPVVFDRLLSVFDDGRRLDGPTTGGARARPLLTASRRGPGGLPGGAARPLPRDQSA